MLLLSNLKFQISCQNYLSVWKKFQIKRNEVFLWSTAHYRHNNMPIDSRNQPNRVIYDNTGQQQTQIVINEQHQYIHKEQQQK